MQLTCFHTASRSAQAEHSGNCIINITLPLARYQLFKPIMIQCLAETLQQFKTEVA
jgi:hypothetical protein